MRWIFGSSRGDESLVKPFGVALDEIGEFRDYKQRIDPEGRFNKGKLLPDYLLKLAQVVTDEQQGIIEELGQLIRGIDHIKTIVAAQQSYAVAVSIVETVPVPELIDDALRMSAGSLARKEVTVVKDIAELPLVSLDRHRVLLILVNLIRNARQALDGVSDRSPCITFRALLTDGPVLRITVADNGQGFPFQGRYSQEELTRRRLGPRTLLERVTSHQGTLTIDSSSSGARLDIAIPWPEAGI